MEGLRKYWTGIFIMLVHVDVAWSALCYNACTHSHILQFSLHKFKIANQFEISKPLVLHNLQVYTIFALIDMRRPFVPFRPGLEGICI